MSDDPQDVCNSSSVENKVVHILYSMSKHLHVHAFVFLLCCVNCFAFLSKHLNDD